MSGRPHALARRFFSAVSPPHPTLKPTVASALRNTDKLAIFAVTGASRGLGLEFCRALLHRSQGRVVAFARTPHASVGLQELVTDHPDRIIQVTLDVTNELSINAAASELKAKLGDSGLDVLINCAGVLHEGTRESMPERSMTECRGSWMHHLYAVNAVGPVLTTAALLPLLSTPGHAEKRPRVVANLSARVGSIGDNRLGGWWSYRMSKSALNMATRNMALEFRRKSVPIHVVCLHPGTNETDLSVPFRKGVKPDKLFKPAWTVNRLLDIIDSLEDKHSGFFYDWDAQPVEF